MKEKLYNIINGLKKINLVLVLFLGYGVKNLLYAPNFASAATLAVLGAIYTASRYIALKEPQKAPSRLKSDIDKLNADVKELKGALARKQVANLAKKERFF